MFRIFPKWVGNVEKVQSTSWCISTWHHRLERHGVSPYMYPYVSLSKQRVFWEICISIVKGLQNKGSCLIDLKPVGDIVHVCICTHPETHEVWNCTLHLSSSLSRIEGQNNANKKIPNNKHKMAVGQPRANQWFQVCWQNKQDRI